MGVFSKWFDLAYTGNLENVKLAEKKRKRTFYLICITIAIPALIGYGIAYLRRQDLLFDAFLNLSVAVCLFSTAVFMKISTKEQVLYRFGIASLGFLFVYNVGFGAHGESEVLWMMLAPLATFYLFGLREGIVWVSLIILPSAAIIIFPDFFNAFPYPLHFRIAFSTVIVLSVILSYSYESLRRHAILRIEKQNDDLKKALADVKQLSGMLPICASCKKIRDDKGYWNQIEEYIGTRSEAEFSHSICPECAKRLYPDINITDT